MVTISAYFLNIYHWETLSHKLVSAHGPYIFAYCKLSHNQMDYQSFHPLLETLWWFTQHDVLAVGNLKLILVSHYKTQYQKRWASYKHPFHFFLNTVLSSHLLNDHRKHSY